MEWLQRIGVSGGALCAEVEAVGGQVSQMALSELAKRGVPTPEALVRKKVDVRFDDFDICGATEYLSHFGIPERGDDDDMHQVFKVAHDGDRYLIPALVLMRALFQPTAHLLHQMFAPNVLPRTCRLNCVDDELSVVIDAHWAKLASVRYKSEWEAPLRWMMLHPTARKMADSVHQYAMSGLIALDLPAGTAEVVFAGVQGEEAVLVTEVRILTVAPGDVPDLPVADWAQRVDYVNRDWKVGRNMTEVLSVEVPTHADGGIELTDEEWAVVSPLLDGPRRGQRPYQLCQRTLFDGVLSKLASGKSWREASYKVGDWRNAATCYNKWNARGALGEAMQALRSMR